jgi:Mg2+ and Co2+ transporter CorA
LDVLDQQRRFFELYRQLLNPKNFNHPPVKRWTRFPFEEASINRNAKETADKISDCKDLLKRADRLAVQNVQLVESYQDDNNRTLMIFTVITIIFLPLSFVTGFFGMNVEGISGTTATVKHFWVIAIPVTAGVGIVSLILIFWARIRRYWTEYKKWRDNRQV